MKYLFLTLQISLFFSVKSFAQIGGVNEELRIGQHEDDSIFFNQDYLLTADSCADIIRLGHFNSIVRKFTGKFTDLSKLNLNQVIAEGIYDENGLKEGNFTSYHLNGNLQAKGNFKDNRFDGKWDFFYPEGQPKIQFEANGNNVKILNTWTEEGKKIIDNGYGPYESIIGNLIWKGLLIGGVPDGKWTAQLMHFSENVFVTERFKYGAFQKGSNKSGDYKDSSRILLVSPELLPFTKAENLWISSEPCNARRKKNIIYARFSKGAEQFAEEIKNRLEPVMNKINPGSFYEPTELQGKILEDGRIIFDTKYGVNLKETSAIISGLHDLPSFEPALIDGKAVQQHMMIIIKYNSSVYSFSYRLLPIKAD